MPCNTACKMRDFTIKTIGPSLITDCGVYANASFGEYNESSP